MGILNRTFSHRNAENEKNPICILWSSVQPFSGIGTWVLNHFVLIKPNSTRQHFILDIADSMEFPPLSTETAEPTEERFTYNDTSETVKHTDERRTNNENDDMTFVSPPFSNPTENSLSGKFMDFDKNLKTLTETRLGDNLSSIPDGRKENMYFLVDNDKRTKTTKRQFTDDCGAWQQSSLKTHYYLKSNLAILNTSTKNSRSFS